MNYLDLCKRVRDECGIGASGVASVTGQTGDSLRIVNWVNQAYKDICGKWVDWKFLWKEGELLTVGTTQDYDLPGDLDILQEDAVCSVVGTERVPLSMISYDDYRFNKHSYDGDELGQPCAYTVLPNGKLRLLPTPSENGKIEYEYQCVAPDLSGNNDAPLFPDAYQDAIIWKAKMYWAQFEEANQEFSIASVFYNDALKRLEARFLPNVEFGHGRAQGANFEVRAQ